MALLTANKIVGAPGTLSGISKNGYLVLAEDGYLLLESGERIILENNPLLLSFKSVGADGILHREHSSAFTPLDLGIKLLRWYHPNDPGQVTESGGIVSQINDQGTQADPAVGGSTPTISGGEITFGGTDHFAMAKLLTPSCEIFVSYRQIGTGLAEIITEANNTVNTDYFSISVSTNRTGQTVAYAPLIISRSSINGHQQVFVDVDLTTGISVVGYRTTGTEYIININGTDYSGAEIIASTGSNNGDWVEDIVGTNRLNFNRREWLSTDVYADGVMGKAGYIITSALTTEERFDLIDWMKTESGI